MENFFVLDDTMRFLYITLRNHRVPLVAIEFIHRGKKWRADTPEEAIKLRRTLEHEDEVLDDLLGTEDSVRSESRWTPDVFWDFVHSVGAQQRIVLQALLEKETVNSAELVKRLKLENEVALGGVISGLSKQLKRFDLKPMELYSVHTDWTQGERTRTFFIHKAFKLAAEESGWPDRKERNAPATKQGRK